MGLLSMPLMIGIAIGYFGSGIINQAIHTVTGIASGALKTVSGKEAMSDDYYDAYYANTPFDPNMPNLQGGFRGDRDYTPYNPQTLPSFSGFQTARSYATNPYNNDPYSAYSADALSEGREPANAGIPGTEIVAPSKRFDRDYQNFEQGNLSTLPPLW